jgi:sialidase-1
VSDPVIELPGGDIMIPLYGGLNAGEQARVLVTRSSDKGLTWHDPVTVAFDPLGCFEFDEPSLVYLPSGKLICMIRVHRYPELEYGYYLYQSESTDLGKTWTAPVKTPIWGHPPHIIRLQSGKLLCVYGYRRPAFGIRACLSHDEGKTWDLANELILRADSVDGDCGYPTSVQLADGRIFTIWYMSEKSTRMAGTPQGIFTYDSPLVFIGGTIYREI